MRDQSRFDLEGRYPDGANLEHVISTATVNVDAVAASQVFVARTRPLAQEGAPRFFALVPIARGSGLTAHKQFADFIVGDFTAVFVDQLETIVLHWHARRAVFHGARNIGDVEV